MSLEYCKLKQQWGNSTYLLEWVKRKTLATLNAVKDTRQQELWFISNGNTIVCGATLKNSLAVSYTTTCTLTIQQWFILVFTKKNWTLLSTQKYSAVYNSFIHHCQTWKQPRRTSVSEWVNKLIYPSNGKLFRAKRVINPREDTEETYMHMTVKSQSEKPVYWMIPIKLHLGKGKPRETV